MDTSFKAAEPNQKAKLYIKIIAPPMTNNRNMKGLGMVADVFPIGLVCHTMA
jgi:hypothetical protein